MSYLIQTEYVKYECTCGSLKPVSKLYFCRHCLELRCGYCVCHEVDSHYCSNCLEHLPSAEAKFRKNRCNTCFDCPNCNHTLSVRATPRSAEDGSTKTPTKHYYLACFFCRWTTRDVGIPDQTTATGNWPIKEQAFSETLTSYLDYYKILAMRERNQKEKKTYSSPLIRGYSSFTEKFGLTSMIARKRAGLPPLTLGGKDTTQSSLPKITPSVAVDNVEPLPDTFFTDLTKITTLSQRHAYPMLQPETVTSLHPQHRHFDIKCSLRCRKCEHNVSKPEYNPASIKFKIQLAAYYHMPEVRIMTFEPLNAGSPSEIVLKITNPTQHLTSLQFGPLNEKSEKKISPKEDTSETKKEKVLVELPRPPRNIKINTDVELPNCSVVLPPRDDAAEYDDSADTHNFHDDPKIVVWRKGNKVALKMKITPRKESKAGQDCVFGFSMEYGYVNTMPTLEQKQPQRAEIQVNLYITPGPIIGSFQSG